jgi:hypothetical protein
VPMVVAVAVSLICPDEARIVAGLVVSDRECSDSRVIPINPQVIHSRFGDGHDRTRRDAPADFGPVMAVVKSGVPAPEATVEAPQSLASGRRASALARGRTRRPECREDSKGDVRTSPARRSGQ